MTISVKSFHRICTCHYNLYLYQLFSQFPNFFVLYDFSFDDRDYQRVLFDGKKIKSSQMNYYEIDTTLNYWMFRLICSIGIFGKFYSEKRVGHRVCWNTVPSSRSSRFSRRKRTDLWSRSVPFRSFTCDLHEWSIWDITSVQKQTGSDQWILSTKRLENRSEKRVVSSINLSFFWKKFRTPVSGTKVRTGTRYLMVRLVFRHLS